VGFHFLLEIFPTQRLNPFSRIAGRTFYFPGKNTEVGFHFLLEEIFPTQRLNPFSSIAGRTLLSEIKAKLHTIWDTSLIQD